MPMYIKKISLSLTPQQWGWLEMERKIKGYKSVQRVIRDWITCSLIKKRQEAFDDKKN